MLTFLFTLALAWTLFWLVMLMLDWGERTSSTDSGALCPTCASKMKPGLSPLKSTPTRSAAIDHHGETRAKPGFDNMAVASTHASSATPIAATNTASENIVKKPVDDQHDQANVTPLFDKPDYVDDLKTIKGIGVVMERTLNDLGITTFKQLASFQQVEVKMVSDVLAESNAGFGDRIERDEWVDQAKDLVKKTS